MDIQRIRPELRKAYSRAPSPPFHRKVFVSFVNLFFKLIPKKKLVDGVSIEEQKIENASVRIYKPAGEPSGAGLIWVHGGGLLIGNPSMDDQLCANYVNNLNLVVVSVDYRLADKHPFPAAIDDCFNAWLWFQQHAENLGVNRNRIAIAGLSAGGGLAASLVQRIFDAGGVQPASQSLLCPMLDDRTAAREELDAIRHRQWNNRSNRAGWSSYLGKNPGLSDAPKYAVPARRKNLAGLPPAWIAVGDIDLFYEEDLTYCQRLRESGVSCEFHVLPMIPHGFESLAPDSSVTKDCFALNYLFLRKSLTI